MDYFWSDIVRNFTGWMLLLTFVIFPILGIGGVIVWARIMERFDLLDRGNRLFEWLAGTKDI